MVHNQRKTERKARKRKKRLEREKASQRQQEIQAKQIGRYPDILIAREGADPEFIAAVTNAVGHIDFTDPAQFSVQERDVYRVIAKHGAAAADAAIKTMSEKLFVGGEVSVALKFPVFHLSLILGEIIFNQIPEDVRKNFLPYNDMCVGCAGTRFVLKFSQLKEQSGPGGTLYFSRHRPRISVNGEDKTVAFSRHAIERICMRLYPRWLSYASAGDAHAIFAACMHFDPVMLHGNQLAFTFFGPCGNENFACFATYVNEVLGEEVMDTTKGAAYYRVGYCPIVVEGDFAKATTFLYPGYTATPEYGALRKSKLPFSEKERLKTLARENNATKTIIDQDVEVIRWFHQNGVPQVIQTQEALYNFGSAKQKAYNASQ